MGAAHLSPVQPAQPPPSSGEANLRKEIARQYHEQFPKLKMPCPERASTICSEALWRRSSGKNTGGVHVSDTFVSVHVHPSSKATGYRDSEGRDRFCKKKKKERKKEKKNRIHPYIHTYT